MREKYERIRRRVVIREMVLDQPGGIEAEFLGQLCIDHRLAIQVCIRDAGAIDRANLDTIAHRVCHG